MKKHLIFAFVLMLTLSTALIIMPNESSASEKETSNSTTVKEVSEDQSNKVSPQMVNPYRYSKENVRVSNEWSSYRRVSDNLRTGSKGGSITSNRSVTFSPVISGSISGINVSTGSSKTSSVGYTLNVGANKSVYMGYRVRYEVERGTRVRTDVVTGKKTRNSYTVKRPLYGEYRLLSY